MIGRNHLAFWWVRKYLIDTTPKKVLDIGTGMGFWGFVVRRYGDIYLGAKKLSERVVELHGVEVFERLRSDWPWLDLVYDKMYWCDVNDVMEELVSNRYDLVLAIDVLEHMKFDAAFDLARAFVSSGSNLIVSLPLADKELYPELDGNKWNKHQETWAREDVERLMEENNGVVLDNSPGKELSSTVLLRA